ncbi:Ribonucleoside-diphosphate reductase subunit beta [compost metagenome]
MSDKLQKPLLFNINGNDTISEQKLIGGNPTGISNLNQIKHKWVNPLYKTMIGNFWIPQKVSLNEDVISKSNLTADENSAVKDTLSFLIFLDSYQTNNLPNIAEYITAPAVKNLFTIQGFQEVIHTESYQYILESLYESDERDKIYDRWRDNPLLLQRNKFIADAGQEFLETQTRQGFQKVMIANYILEGVYFYQGFQFFDQLAHRQKLVKTDKVIDYIRRDELTHVGLNMNVIKDEMTGTKTGIKKHTAMIQDMFGRAVEEEIKWCHEIYGNKILGISKKSSADFVMDLANDRLERIGIEKLYPDVSNPYKHLNQSAQEGSTRENFFETTTTSYNQAGSLSGWDKL